MKPFYVSQEELYLLCFSLPFLLNRMKPHLVIKILTSLSFEKKYIFLPSRQKTNLSYPSKTNLSLKANNS